MMKIPTTLTLQLLAVAIWMTAVPNNAVTAFAVAPSIQSTSPLPRTIVRAGGDDDEPDLVAKRIIVSGDVQGGYYRSCVLNEVSFSKLKCVLGAMDSSFVVLLKRNL